MDFFVGRTFDRSKKLIKNRA